MDARRDKTWRSQGWFTTAVPRKGQAQANRRRLRDMMVAEGLAKQHVRYVKGWALQKLVLTADIKAHWIYVIHRRPTAPST